MKTALFFVALCLGLSGHLYADFEHTYHTLPSGSWEFGYALTECPEGGFLLGATLEGFGRSTLLIRTNSRGDTLWMRQYGGYGNEMTCVSVFALPDGGCITGGTATDSVFNKALIIRFDESGDTLWTRRYYNGRNCSARATVPALEQGCLVVCAEVERNDWYLVRTNEIGETLWTKELNYGFNPASNRPTAVLALPDSSFLIAGRAARPDLNGNLFLVRLSSTGDSIWTRSFGMDCGEERISGNCYKIIPTREGDILLIGDEYCESCCSDGYVIKIHKDGTVVWQNHYDHANRGDSFTAGVGTDDGGFLLVGYCDWYMGAGTRCDGHAWLVRTNSEGDTLWTRTYGPTQTGALNDIIRTRDGGFAVVGTISTGFGTDSFDVYLVKLDPSGVVEWERTISPNGLTAYPNPSVGTITIELPAISSGNNGFKVTDAFGRTVFGLPRIATPFDWQFPPELPNGVYFLQVGSDGTGGSKRIMLTR